MIASPVRGKIRPAMRRVSLCCFVQIIITHYRTGILAFGIDVAVDEFDYRHRCSVGHPDASFNDTAVTTRAFCVARGQCVEQFNQLGIVE